MQPTSLGTRDNGLENGTETWAEDYSVFSCSESLEESAKMAWGIPVSEGRQLEN